MDKALELLAFRARSESELETRLRRTGYPPHTVAAVLDRCRELGYVDDEMFALSHVRDRLRLRPRGRRALRSELGRKGVAPDVAAAAIDAGFEEVGLEEAALAGRLARKRARSLDGANRDVARRRLAAYLARRGFAPDIVRRAVADALSPGPGGGSTGAAAPTRRLD